MSGKVLGKDGRNAFNLENALSLDKCQEFTLYKTKSTVRMCSYIIYQVVTDVYRYC